MSDILWFASREALREWLARYGSSSDGVWLVFGKKGSPETINPSVALEEALCFGWIDGQIQSIDGTVYKKYFARRSVNSIWSDRNKKLAMEPIERGRITQSGIDAIERAKECGTWNGPGRTLIGIEQIDELAQIIKQYEPAFANFSRMPASVQRTYTALYMDAKTDKTRQARLERIVDRLNRNLKPM